VENYIEYFYQDIQEKQEDFIYRINELFRYKSIVSIQFLEDNDSYYLTCIVTWKKEIT